MPDQNAERLADLLTRSHKSLQDTIEGIDLNSVIYGTTGWTIGDILWHLAVWDREVTKSIIASKEGGEYSISDFDEDDFNQRAFLKGKNLSNEKLLEEFFQARQNFKNAVQVFPFDVSGEFLYPWGDERGDISKLVNYMVEHDEEHRHEIIAVISSAKRKIHPNKLENS